MQVRKGELDHINAEWLLWDVGQFMSVISLAIYNFALKSSGPWALSFRTPEVWNPRIG